MGVQLKFSSVPYSNSTCRNNGCGGGKRNNTAYTYFPYPCDGDGDDDDDVLILLGGGNSQ